MSKETNMTSPVKRPKQPIDEKVSGLFDKLDEVALKHDKN